MSQQQSPRQPARSLPAHEGGSHSSLVTRLGFKKVAEHIDELRLFYLIGCAYHRGARSLRRVAKMLRAPAAEGLGRRDGEGLPKSLRTVHRSVGLLEDLLGEKLVNRTGEGLGYDGLTEAGEQFWRLTAEFVRESWA